MITNASWSQSLFMYPACANGIGIDRRSNGALEDAAHLRRRLERAVVEPRALRRAGGAARPHDARRIRPGCASGNRASVRRSDRGALHLGARHITTAGRVARARAAPGHSAALVDQHRGLALGEDRGDLRRTEPGVDAGGHRAQPARRRVPHREVDRRPQVQRHHVARPRRRARPASPPSESARRTHSPKVTRCVAFDVRDRVRERAGDLAEELAERGALELRLPRLRLLGQRFSTSMPLLSASQVFGPTPSSRSCAFRIFFISLRGNSSRISM